MSYDELRAEPRWRATGNTSFPAAAEVGGRWWVLRLNCFPDHPLWTLFVDGVGRFDTDGTPPAWGRPLTPSAPPLDARTGAELLGPLLDFAAYGSEAGDPCDNPFCCG
ncbi:hypothetical protein ACFYW1_26175 [Streptomyces sp. NPDC002669]|uniref:hypothetical protein n=1 Tax=unclassified Streptomyces TaxID=2593676 RepID=UPI0036C50E0F